MDWKDLKGIVTKAAPLIGNAIGGPAGGMVAGWIASELGEDVDPSDPVALANAINGDPNSLFKLKELEARNKEELQKIGLELFRSEVADKDSAREREKAYIAATGGRDYFLIVMAVMVTFGFFGILIGLLFLDIGKMSAAALSILNIMIGVLGTNFNNIIGYFFGSSKGSNDKNKFANLK